MERYDEARFRQAVDAAMQSIRTILDNTRSARSPRDVPHQYEDKYVLAEFLARTSIAAILQTLGGLGLSDEGLAQLIGWARERSVTLRFQAQESCSFLREETRQVDSAQQVVTEKRGFFGTDKIATKVVTTVNEFFWGLDFSYELIAFRGNETDKPLRILSRTGHVELKTGARTRPRPEKSLRTPLDVNLTWLLGKVDAQHRASLSIDRTSPACHTPRRNPQIHDALTALGELSAWCTRVRDHFLREQFTAQPDHGRDLSALHARTIFVPVVPVFEASPHVPGVPDDASVGERSITFAGPFLAEQQRTLQERVGQLAQLFPRDTSLVTVTDAVLLVTLQHLADIAQRFTDGVDHLEALLREQLIAAIGKELTPADFSAYMDFHLRKLFQPDARPEPFSHAVRRPDHAPEGTLSLEARHDHGDAEPIATSVVHSRAHRPMTFALDAATRVAFLGERHVHAWVAHQFTRHTSLSLDLVARARQFSSFILLAGRIASADTFEPRLAVILQNKDLLKIPLLLDPIPTPKEFRDAIESLSPEQQRFARAFRAMQLESTLFGVCVIQIKPQLEALLKLPPDSLTKEIKLTQDLLSLFIEYQIPSDLISYDGPADASAAHKLARVTEHVDKMLAMIAQSRSRELEEARERESFRRAEADRTYNPPPPMAAPAPFGPPPASFGPPGGYGGPSTGAPPPPSPGPAPQMARMAAPAAMAPPPAPAAPPPPPMQVAPAPRPTTATITPAAHAQTTSPPARTAPAGSPAGAPAALELGDDYTRIPAELDRRFETIDEDSALRPTILKIGELWTRTSHKGLLAAATTDTLDEDDQEKARHQAFDLLDALSRSGALPIEHASLHVVVAATHSFDKTLIDTVIEDNVNPIEKVERSVMIVATTIHDRPAVELLAPDQRERFLTLSPMFGALPGLPTTRG